MQMNFQIGKSGVTEGVIESLKLGFKTHKVIKISVLRSYSPSKEKVNEIAKEIAGKLGPNYNFVTIGFTIVMRK